VSHPGLALLLDAHFGEASASERDGVARHSATCAECAGRLRDFGWAEAALGGGLDATPPVDGLERVLLRVAAARPKTAPARRRTWRRAAAPGALALAGGAWGIGTLGARLLGAGLAPEAGLASFATLWGFGVAAAAFFAAGSLVTLAIAPLLILEAQARAALRPASR
jgi:hypothetical protein